MPPHGFLSASFDMALLVAAQPPYLDQQTSRTSLAAVRPLGAGSTRLPAAGPSVILLFAGAASPSLSRISLHVAVWSSGRAPIVAAYPPGVRLQPLRPTCSRFRVLFLFFQPFSRASTPFQPSSQR